MMRLALLALAGLGVLLAGTIAGELALPDASADGDSTGVVAAPRLPRAVSGKVAATGEDHTDAWVATILARPLFTRDRRPATAKSAAEVVAQVLPRLTGIAVSPSGRAAIFAGTAGGKPLVVSEGGSVGTYTVKSIGPDVVMIAGPDGARRLSPTFDPNATSPAIGVPGVPGMAQPGMAQPGMAQPGMAQPGLFQPGVLQPGMQPPFGAPLPGQFRPGNGAFNGPRGVPRALMAAQPAAIQQPTDGAAP